MKSRSITTRTLAFGLLLTGIAGLGACRKNQQDDLSTQDKKEATDNANSASMYEDAVILTEEAITTGQVSGYVAPGGCAVVTLDTVSVPHSVTIDFGSTNCLCLDGRYRRGSISATWTGTLPASGSSVSLSFTGYAVDDNAVGGTIAVTYDGQDGQGNWSASMATSGTITLADGAGSVTWQASLTRAQTAGASTPTVFNDDKYQVTGSMSGTFSSGRNFTATITSPLVRDYSCIAYYTQGTVSIVSNLSFTKTINFGSGACDDEIVVTVGGIDYIVNL